MVIIVYQYPGRLKHYIAVIIVVWSFFLVSVLGSSWIECNTLMDRQWIEILFFY